MPLPPMTPELRAAYRAAAQQTRSARSDLKGRLKRGELTLAGALAGDVADVAGGIRVRHLLLSLPGVGTVRAEKAMREVGIAENRKVSGLGERQRRELLELFAPVPA